MEANRIEKENSVWEILIAIILRVAWTFFYYFIIKIDI